MLNITSINQLMMRYVINLLVPIESQITDLLYLILKK